MDRDRTVDKIDQIIREAGGNGAQLVMFPETIIPSYPYWALVKDPSSSLKAFHRELSLQAVHVEGPEMITSLGEGGSVAQLSPGGGYSTIVDPSSQYLAGPATEGETLLYAELDFTRIVEIKRIVDSAGHYARPDVVHLVVNRKKQHPIIFNEE